MPMTAQEKRQKQHEYNRQYYLAHRDRKLRQNAASARRWRQRNPEKYRLSQERCRQRAREMRGLVPRPSRLRECDVCHEVKPHKARGMCLVCYGRWRWQQRKQIVAGYQSEAGTISVPLPGGH